VRSLENILIRFAFINLIRRSNNETIINNHISSDYDVC
jgi:hypothetical protein